jgi:hypothetical protein
MKIEQSNLESLQERTPDLREPAFQSELFSDKMQILAICPGHA